MCEAVRRCRRLAGAGPQKKPDGDEEEKAGQHDRATRCTGGPVVLLAPPFSASLGWNTVANEKCRRLAGAALQEKPNGDEGVKAW